MDKNIEIDQSMVDYIFAHSNNLHPIQKKIIKYNESLGYVKKLQISVLQANFIQFLIQQKKFKNCLEIGTFTGYSALSIALSLPSNGRLYAIDKDKKNTDKVLVNGWLHTGDIGILDTNGYIKITDRSKDMFIVGGFNAYPAEIENILCDHPAISQAAVIGIKDERMGEVAKAFVLLKPDHDLNADSLLQWSKDNMANYKVPREVEFVRELPTNAAGKIMKYLLKDES